MNKEEFRKNCIQKNRKINGRVNVYKIKKNALNNLSKLLDKLISTKINKINKKMNILFYLSLDMEVPTFELINKYRKKHNIFVPFIEKSSFKMLIFRLPLTIKKFNIKSTNNSYSFLSKKKKIDIMIVPIVGMDVKSKRIGFGKGMYDRFYSNLKIKPIIIFTQLKKCFSLDVISEWHDIKGDFIIDGNSKFK